MKKIYSLLIVLIAFVLVGCGGLDTGGGEVSVDEPVEKNKLEILRLDCQCLL